MTLTLTQAVWLAVLTGVLVGTLVGARLSASLHDRDRRELEVARQQMRMTCAFMLGIADSLDGWKVDTDHSLRLRDEARDLLAVAGYTMAADARDRHPSGSWS